MDRRRGNPAGDRSVAAVAVHCTLANAALARSHTSLLLFRELPSNSVRDPDVSAGRCDEAASSSVPVRAEQSGTPAQHRAVGQLPAAAPCCLATDTSLAAVSSGAVASDTSFMPSCVHLPPASIALSALLCSPLLRRPAIPYILLPLVRVS